MNNYIFNGLPIGTTSLHIEITGLPETITVEGTTLLRKTEFHVSLVCPQKFLEKNNLEIPNFYEEVATALKEFELPIAFERFSGEFRLVEEGPKKSIIAMCEVSNLREFLGRLGAQYHLDFEYPPLHVTLFTSLPNDGIYVINQRDLDGLTKVIPSPLGNLDINRLIRS